MPITCGSVGDIISLSLLIKDLVKSLDKSRGSSAEYEAVIHELWSLDHALIEVEMLRQSCEQMVQLYALSATVKECAEQCRKCITKFQGQMKKYEKSLQSDGSGNFIRDTAFKLRWQVSKKEDLAKFRAEINAHCFSINMLLATTGVTLSKLNDANLHKSLKQSELSRIKSSATQSSELAEIKSRLEENTALAKAAASETKKLSLRFDVNYFKNLGADILSFMQKIWRVNLLTYKAVISLQTSIPAQLERCWTQDPAILEDALGRVSPVHLEFLDSWEAFESVLEIRFRRLPGHRKYQQREYALRINALKRDVEQSLAFNRCFLPGQRIDMSMIFNGGFGSPCSCPGCKRVTSKTEEDTDSQVQCPGCKMWYQRVLETSTTEIIPMTTIEPKAVLQDRQLPMSRPQKRLRIDDEDSDDNPAQFRRVRLRYWDQDQQPESSLALDQGDPIDANAMHDELNQTDLDYLGRLSRFHKQNSTDLSRRLSINNQPLALYELKKAVARCGGFEKVCRLNKWAKIGRDLRCSERITSSPSTLLRDLYQRWLHPYEQYLKVAEPAAATSASNIPADDGQDLRTRQTAFQSQKLRRDSQSSGSDSLIMPRFHPANLNHLSHPIGTIYMPNAQLMYSSDEESDVTEAELPALNARMSQSSQPSHRGTAPSFSNPAIASYLRNREEPRLPQFKAQHSTLPRPEEHQAFSYHGPPPSDIGTSRLSVAGGSAKDTDAFAFSLVNSNPPFHALGSNGVFNERSHAFATPPQLSYESMANNPRPDFSELQQIAASFARQGF